MEGSRLYGSGSSRRVAVSKTAMLVLGDKLDIFCDALSHDAILFVENDMEWHDRMYHVCWAMLNSWPRMLDTIHGWLLP